MTKTPITNDKPKGALSEKGIDLAVNVAFELGKRLGRGETAKPEGDELIQNTQQRGAGPFGFKLPAAERPGHIPPKAGDPVVNREQGDKPNLHRPPAAFKLPKAEG